VYINIGLRIAQRDRYGFVLLKLYKHS